MKRLNRKTRYVLIRARDTRLRKFENMIETFNTSTIVNLIGEGGMVQSFYKNLNNYLIEAILPFDPTGKRKVN